MHAPQTWPGNKIHPSVDNPCFVRVKSIIQNSWGKSTFYLLRFNFTFRTEVHPCFWLASLHSTQQEGQKPELPIRFSNSTK